MTIDFEEVQTETICLRTSCRKNRDFDIRVINSLRFSDRETRPV